MCLEIPPCNQNFVKNVIAPRGSTLKIRKGCSSRKRVLGASVMMTFFSILYQEFELRVTWMDKTSESIYRMHSMFFDFQV